MKSLGICAGASTLKATVIDFSGNKPEIISNQSITHESNPRTAFISLLDKFSPGDISYCTLTGRNFRNIVNLTSVTEPEALEAGLKYLHTIGVTQTFDSLISLGAENFIVYNLDKHQCISSIETGNKCASGTGDFFLQQIRRMGLTITEAVECANDPNPYKVSGRCSVFCKSDCTHTLNKGIPVGRVSAGLCRMIADKILDLLEKSPGKNIIAVGGVTLNPVVMNMIREAGVNLYIPPYSDTFESLGAAWHAYKKKVKFIKPEPLIAESHISFRTHLPLLKAADKVTFETIKKSQAEKGDTLIVGLDVGSTTTKAVALREKDNAIVAQIYLRTNGNPVQASRDCYRELLQQLPQGSTIKGLGTTGSGRHIAGLHAGTPYIINEIIAHATAAAFFDPEVDTIFEIGGQDAKYTYLTNGVPSDYAMNEACSAGTGSFLEEAAYESLGINYKEIQEIAIKSEAPPDFNDQCAAFISSDIKTASHEGVSKEDIVGGLVYSICMNYVNRVRGQRPTGKKIFMQGGVCYNKAVPLAMANLIDRNIIVPPEPGLMGAFGVALEVKNRLQSDEEPQRSFELQVLADREIQYGKSFICHGGTEHCDRRCEINMLHINGKGYPFGGACYRYYNQIHKSHKEQHKLDYVKIRQQIIFEPVTNAEVQGKRIRVGLNNSFLISVMYPMYATFFSELGVEVVLSDAVDQNGVKKKRSSFCYPAEIAHGSFQNLLSKKTDYIFLPAVSELYVENSGVPRKEHRCTCMTLQSEPYVLRRAFDSIKPTLISPVLDFSKGYESQTGEFIKIGMQLGFSADKSLDAYTKAVQCLRNRIKRIRSTGDELLSALEKDPDQIAIVLFGRSYNSFADEANMGIPAKFASRGITIIPWDMLPYEKEPFNDDINWAIAQNILRSAKIVSRHNQLFGAFVTNFSCGPDSFVLGYFRDIMGSKPSLTLELDSHTADAGINTRIEAFMDVVERYRKLGQENSIQNSFNPARIEITKSKPLFIDSKNQKISFNDPSIHVLFPSMGKLTSEAIAAVFYSTGTKATAVPVYDQNALKAGRAHASCKECLPLLLTTGGLLKYLETRTSSNEKLIYFMPTCGGNCRFTQYNVFLHKLINKNQIPDVALLTLSNENGYAGLALPYVLNVLKSIIIADCMDDIRNALFTLAKDRKSAMKKFDDQWSLIIDTLQNNKGKGLFKTLNSVVKELSQIPLKMKITDAPVVSLMGEIFVRRDYFSCQDILERLATRNIIVKRAPISEWLDYCDYNVKTGIYESQFGIGGQVEFHTKVFLQKWYENKIGKLMEKSGLYIHEPINIPSLIKYGKYFFDERFTGEAILVAGSFYKHVLHSIQGAISIGPFACMPTRVTEATVTSQLATSCISTITDREIPPVDIATLPFLSIETDGGPFSQIIETRIEAFCLQVERVHQQMQHSHYGNHTGTFQEAIIVDSIKTREKSNV